jgi:hypothetical protein
METIMNATRKTTHEMITMTLIALTTLSAPRLRNFFFSSAMAHLRRREYTRDANFQAVNGSAACFRGRL